jgi:MSHA pilin protein MshD
MCISNQTTEDRRQGTDGCRGCAAQSYSMFRAAEHKSLSSVLCPPSSERGISLVELIMFIVIVSVALAGIMLVINTVTRSSVDPLIHKQALAIAESLLEEVELMPFTFCDPDDPNAASALAAANCTGGAGGANDESALPLGPEGAGSVGGAEGRYAAPQFDNVSDYNGFIMAAGAILDIAGSNTGLNGYTLQPIVVAPVALPGVAANDALLITVTVTGPNNLRVVVDGIRTRYSPRAMP